MNVIMLAGVIVDKWTQHVKVSILPEEISTRNKCEWSHSQP